MGRKTLDGERDSEGRAPTTGRAHVHVSTHSCRSLAHVRHSVAGGTLSGIEPYAVVFDHEHRAVTIAFEADLGGAGLGVTGDVGEGFAGQLHDVSRVSREAGRQSRVDCHLDLLDVSRLELVPKVVKRLLELAIGKDARAQAEDVVAEVSYDSVELIHRPLDPGAGLRVGRDQGRAL